MKQLTCEMCGSTDLLKQDGVFVCQTCGCKYSVEEARKMMVEGTVEVQGTVKIDREGEQRKLIENYLEMCKNASDALDTNTVVEYSDKILEMDPNNYEAWKYRALSCGWGSSINNMKIGQILTAAKKALDLAPDYKRYDLAEEIYYQGKLQIVSHLNTIFSLSSTAVLTMSLTMLTKQAEMAGTVMGGWLQLIIGIPYISSETLKEEISDCKVLEEKHSVIMGTAADTYNNKEKYHESMQRLLGDKLETVSKERDAIYAARREAYWKEHPEEKMALEKEKEALDKQVNAIQAELDNDPVGAAYSAARERVDVATKELNEFAKNHLFKMKEKKVYQEKVDAAKHEMYKYETQYNELKKEKEEKMTPFVTRIVEIEAELNKVR